MSNLKNNLPKYKSFLKITTACFLILINGFNLFAQYKGAPVKQERLLKVLRSRQLQTRDIVSVISSNGVDFRMTPEIKKLLVAAGARPEVIQAAANNSRVALKGNSMLAKNENRKKDKKVAPNYDDLLEQAIYSYKDQQNPSSAVQYLKTAAKLQPKNPAAYQMLGFVNMYGLKNITQAEKIMWQSIENGGSAVFRVYHDDEGSFNGRCSGSLYISPETIRFESDDNRHTFETSSINIDKIKLDRESNKNWKKHSIFKIFLKIGKDKANFRFAPISGAEDESRMVSRFVNVSRTGKMPPVSTTASAVVYSE